MNNLINGRALAETINLETAKNVRALKRRGITPKLAVVYVGSDKPSQKYIDKKRIAAETAGIDFALYTFPASVKKDALISELTRIQKDKKLSGLIIQLPLPERLYQSDVLNAIDQSRDVDCLTDANLGKLVMKTNLVTPPTPEAVLTVLRSLEVELPGKNVTIIGTGALVGKPLAIMLMNEGSSIITANSRTRDIKAKCLTADIIVTAVGKKDLLRGDMVSPGAIVIDTGIDFEDGKMYGDVNRAEVAAKAAWLTPTPGGIGPITVSLLLKNTVTCAKQRSAK